MPVPEPTRATQVLLARADALHRSGHLGEAAELYGDLLQHFPDQRAALNGLGTLRLHQGNAAEGVRLLERSLRLAADQPDILCNYGAGLQKLGRLEEAIAMYSRAIELRPDIPEAYSNRGFALNELDRWSEGLADCDRALSLRPSFAAALNNRGIALHRLGRFAEALESFDRAIALAPGSADAHANLGTVLADANRLPEAIAIDPRNADTLLGKGMAQLAMGRYEEGWQLYEWRRAGSRRRGMAHGPAPLWLGDDQIAGRTILLKSEQGLGDTIQFSRFVTQVKALGAHVMLSVLPSLQRLMRSLAGVDELTDSPNPAGRVDCYCPLPSLPLALRTSLDAVPADVPYLRCDGRESDLWKRRLAGAKGLRVGVTWASGFGERSVYAHGQQWRDIPLACFESLAIPGVTFYSLQKGAAAMAELEALVARSWRGPRILDYTDELHDFAATAALVDNLDVVISVCTSVAHLAGAMGKSTWVLLKHGADWRWLIDRTDSPWYPTAILFRQPSFNDWAAVVQDVRERLTALASRTLSARC